MVATLFFACILLLALGYRYYGRRLASWLGLDDRQDTPATVYRDGVDFEPTPKAVLLGHHFSSIAGAGPIVGPIVAAKAFGWGPALLWIVIGARYSHTIGALRFGRACLCLGQSE